MRTHIHTGWVICPFVLAKALQESKNHKKHQNGKSLKTQLETENKKVIRLNNSSPNQLLDFIMNVMGHR